MTTPGPSPGTVSRYDWSQAPEWAMFAATDSTGHAYWYSAKPKRDEKGSWWKPTEGAKTERMATLFPVGSTEAEPRPSQSAEARPELSTISAIDSSLTVPEASPTHPSPVATTRGVTEEMVQEWRDAYAAFKGAFDTPQARMKDRDEYSEDARQRLYDFNESFTAALAPQDAEESK